MRAMHCHPIAYTLAAARQRSGKPRAAGEHLRSDERWVRSTGSSTCGETIRERSSDLPLAVDERLSAFAAELDDRFTFVDLRSPPVDMGFSWGRYGPRTDVRRHGHEALFAYAPPAKGPGLLARLFG